MEKQHFAMGLTVLAMGIILGALITYQLTTTLYLQGRIGFGFSVNKPRFEVHSTITIYQGDKLILSEYNAGVVTDLGDNQTLYKLFGNSSYQYVDIPYLDNATFISIGNDTGTLATTSVVLPNEWNRTAGTIEVISQSQINITATFLPTGNQVADCIGLNFNGTALANNLWGYDTFTEVTGIDDTFTINIEFEIIDAHV